MEAALNAHLLFWTAEHNPARTGAALCDDSTVPGHQRRLRAFAAFAAETAPTAFGVASIPSNPFALLFADTNCTALTVWLDALAARDVGPGGRAGYCNCVISYLKVVLAAASTNPGANPDIAATVTAALAATQRVRSALQAQYDTQLKGRSDKEQLAALGKFAEWDDITEATHELVRIWRALERTLAKQQQGRDVAHDGTETPLAMRCGRAATSALMALINVVLLPSRSLELRTLEAPVGVAPPATEGRNVVVALPNGGFQLCFDRFKTVKKLGRQIVVLPDSKDLLDALRAVAYTHRATLVGRETGHRFLFVGPSGKPYGSSGAWNSALVSVFAAPFADVQPQWAASAGAGAGAAAAPARVAPRIGPNVLRKSAVTNKLPECKTPAEQKSLAACLRHGLGAQGKHYDAATSSERVAAAINASARAYDASAGAGSAGRAVASTIAGPVKSVGSVPVGPVMRERVPATVRDVGRKGDASDDSDVGASDSDDSSSAQAAPATAAAASGAGHNAAVANDSDSEEPVFVVDRLLQFRVRGGEPQYFVRWATGAEDDSWEPEDEMPQALVRLFWRGPTARGGKGATGVRGGKRKATE
jgi:hypothetical protein